MNLPIDPWIFLISFSIGMMIAYIATPPPRVIIRFPTLNNAGKILYKDDAGVCYRYLPQKVSCPSDPNEIFRPPLQVVDEQEMNEISSGSYLMKRMGAWWNETTTSLQEEKDDTNEENPKQQ
jgi:hypothetical protein